MEKLVYDIEQYPFRTRVEKALGGHDLEHLPPIEKMLSREQDQSTVWHQRFYRQFPWKVAPLYQIFVHKVIEPQFGEPIIYQRVPTFRVALPNNVAVGEWHRDRDYGHFPYEINFWLPLMDVADSATVWIEQENGECQPVPVRYGEVLVFDSVNLLHGNIPNVTGASRASFDFRCYPARLHQDREVSSINGIMRFKLESYWSATVKAAKRSADIEQVDG